MSTLPATKFVIFSGSFIFDVITIMVTFCLKSSNFFSRNSQFFSQFFFCALVGFDVVNMFPNIDNKSGLLSVKEA